MDCRGFLSSLLKGAAALGYVAAVGLPSLAEATPVQVEQAIKATLQWLATEVARQVSNHVGPLTLTDSTMLDGVMQHQLSVGLQLPAEGLTPTEYRVRYVEPIVASLASGLTEKGVTKCGVLPMPDYVYEGCVVTDKTRGMSLRALKYYEIQTDTYVIRLDVLAG